MPVGLRIIKQVLISKPDAPGQELLTVMHL